MRHMNNCWITYVHWSADSMDNKIKWYIFLAFIFWLLLEIILVSTKEAPSSCIVNKIFNENDILKGTYRKYIYLLRYKQRLYISVIVLSTAYWISWYLIFDVLISHHKPNSIHLLLNNMKRYYVMKYFLCLSDDVL